MPNGNESEINTGLLSTLRSSRAFDVAVGLGEVGLDRLLEEGALRDIPILGSAVGLAQAHAGIKTIFLAKKITLFLIEFAGVPEEERIQFAERIEGDCNFRGKAGEQVLLILDRLDDVEKASLVAKAFTAYLRNEITYPDLKGMVLAIDRCLIDDLIVLREEEARTSYVPEIGTRLMSCGVLQQDMIPILGADGNETEITYRQTPLAELIKRILL